MKAIEFPGVNVRLAENQPQYETLPVFYDHESEEKPAIMCFELDEEEKKQIKETGKIYLTVLTFGHAFQPLGQSCLKPDVLNKYEEKSPSGDLGVSFPIKISDDLSITYIDVCTDNIYVTVQYVGQYYAKAEYASDTLEWNGIESQQLPEGIHDAIDEMVSFNYVDEIREAIKKISNEKSE